MNGLLDGCSLLASCCLVACIVAFLVDGSLPLLVSAFRRIGALALDPQIVPANGAWKQFFVRSYRCLFFHGFIFLESYCGIAWFLNVPRIFCELLKSLMESLAPCAVFTPARRPTVARAKASWRSATTPQPKRSQDVHTLICIFLVQLYTRSLVLDPQILCLYV